jgi:hypothetical protein
VKSLFSYTIILALVLALSPTSNAQRKRRDNATVPQQGGMVPLDVPEELILLLELQDLPGGATKGSFWEVSYRWYIEDKSKVEEQLFAGKNLSNLAGGLLLGKGSFRPPNLSTKNRRLQLTASVKDELLRRIQKNGEQPQLLWLIANIRVHDSKFSPDPSGVVETGWMLGTYPKGTIIVRVEVTPKGELNWSRPSKSQKGTGQAPKVKKS